MRSLFYYYKAGLTPFLNIMELPDEEIVAFMRCHLPDDPIFHANPEKYLRRRKETEAWLHCTFCDKGGKPAAPHPIYMTLGRSSYIEELGVYTECIEVPLALFSPSKVSFTYPDSYVSRLLAVGTNDYFNPRFHGQVFTLAELDSLLADGTVHNEAWREEARKNDFFIEAHVWDTEILRTYLRGGSEERRS